MAVKRFSVFGDSISTLAGYTPQGWRNFYEGAEADEAGVHAYEDTWWGQVIDHFGGELLANAAYSGSLVEGDGFPSGTAPERIAALAGVPGMKALQAGATPVAGDAWGGEAAEACETAKAAEATEAPEVCEPLELPEAAEPTVACETPESLESPDVILVFIGINDYGWGSSAAAVLGASAAAPVASARQLGNDVYGRMWQPSELPSAEESQVARTAFEAEAADNPLERLTRFACAYDLMLTRMRASYPQAEIWCCTLVPGRVHGMQLSTHTYNLRGIPFADYNKVIRQAAENNGVQVADIFAAGQDYEAFDGTHPTALGMRQISQMVIAAMEGTSFPADPVWQSTDPCVLRSASAVHPVDGGAPAPSPVAAESSIADSADDSAEVACTSGVKNPLYTPSLPQCCETCLHSDIEPHRWSCVCNASIKPL